MYVSNIVSIQPQVDVERIQGFFTCMDSMGRILALESLEIEKEVAMSGLRETRKFFNIQW